MPSGITTGENESDHFLMGDKGTLLKDMAYILYLPAPVDAGKYLKTGQANSNFGATSLRGRHFNPASTSAHEHIHQ